MRNDTEKTPQKKNIGIIALNIALCGVAAFLLLFFVGRVTLVKLNEQAAELLSGELFQITAQVQPSHAFNKQLHFSSDNEAVAMVDSAGRVTAFQPGNAVITVSAADGSGQSDRLWVKVQPPSYKGIAILTEARELEVGEELQIAYRVQPENEEVSWSCNNPAIAQVDNMGIVVAYQPGIATVRADLANGNFDEVVLTVVDANAKVMPVEDAKPAQNAQRSEAKLMLVGDLMCLYGQRVGAVGEEDMDFSGSFSQVKDILSRADIVAGCLETTVAPSFPYTQPNPSAMEAGYKPVLNAPVEFLQALKNGGFDTVMTAGNHCCDAGAQGIQETVENLDEVGLKHTGTFVDKTTPRYMMGQAGDIKLAFLSYSEFFNGKEALLSSEERGYMINAFSEERVREDVQAARVAGAEFVIAYNHWGTENKQTVDAQQKEHAQILADAGVDMIVGTHPHCLQPAEYLTAANGKKVLCFYSLGNFVSSMTDQANTDTVIADIQLIRDEEGVELASASYIPCRIFSEYEEASFVVIPIVDAGSQATRRIAEAMGEAIGANIEEIGEEEWQASSYLIQEN